MSVRGEVVNHVEFLAPIVVLSGVRRFRNLTPSPITIRECIGLTEVTIKGLHVAWE